MYYEGERLCVFHVPSLVEREACLSPLIPITRQLKFIERGYTSSSLKYAGDVFNQLQKAMSWASW